MLFYACLFAAAMAVATKPFLAISAMAAAFLFSNHESEGLAALIFVAAVAGNLAYFFY